MSDFDLEYLIIYENDGTPVYSRCFANMCKVSMQNDVLFSAFLSSLSTFASVDDRPQLDEIELEGTMIKVEYSQEKKLSSLLMEDLRLIFLYSQNDKYTMAAGFDADAYEKANGYERVVEFLEMVEEFLGKHDDIDWGFVEMETLLAFEAELLRTVIHPFFNKHDMKAKCPFGDNCPLRIAMLEEQGTIFERLRNKIEEYRGMNMFKKIWRMMFGSSYKART